MLRFCGLVGLCTPPKSADDPNRREPAVTYPGPKCVGSGARGVGFSGSRSRIDLKNDEK